MKKVCWPYFDPEFDTLPERIYGPACRVTIDNESLEGYTVIKVDSVNKQGLLLEVVQVLTDTNLQICKSYISSDAGWFMDVFHVRDEHGNKLKDQNVINHIQQAIGRSRGSSHSVMAKTCSDQNEHTAIEITGADRFGLFSEISAALADLNCNIVEAHAWTHNARLACVAYISDQSTHSPIEDPNRLAAIEDRLTTVLRATRNPNSPIGTLAASQQEAKMAELAGAGEGTVTTVERRLHQLMVSVRDFETPSFRRRSRRWKMEVEGDDGKKTKVRIERCEEKRYSIVSVECKDRPRLMFDTVCTLTDMHYVIFHASITVHATHAFQEYFIRHIDGYALNTEGEEERVAKCLVAAIERRVCEGIRVELCAEKRVGLVSDITRMLRENGVAVTRADVETHGDKSVNAFYVRGMSENELDIDDFIERVKREMGPIYNNIVLHINNNHHTCNRNMPRHTLSLGHKLPSPIQRLSHAFVQFTHA